MWNEIDIRNAITSSLSLKATLKLLGIPAGGRGYYKMKQYIVEHNIDTSHFRRIRDHQRIDFSNQKFHSITFIAPTTKKHKQRAFIWEALCDCGNTFYVVPHRVIDANKKHCGCQTYGRRSREMRMLTTAKRRAKLDNLPFNLEKKDIVIPIYCPVLGIKLERENKTACDNSPSLDKLIPALGYVKGNVYVISYRANFLKNNASLEELERLVSYVKDRITPWFGL